MIALDAMNLFCKKLVTHVAKPKTLRVKYVNKDGEVARRYIVRQKTE